MSETTLLGLVGGVLWGVVMAFAGVIWALLQGKIVNLETKVDRLESQNTAQETAIGRLTEKTLALVDKHEEHRSDISGRLDRLEAKIDRLLGASRGSPFPAAYGPQKRGEGGGER
jgi:hypothetical protein